MEAAKPRPAVRHLWLDELIEMHGPAMRRMLRRMLRDDEEVNDVYQDCICRLAGRTGVAPVQDAGAYAFQTAANLAIETIRRRRRRAGHWDRVVLAARERYDARADNPAGRAQVKAGPRLGELRSAVAALPRHLRDVVVLRDLMGLPYGRVGEMLGIRPTTARVYRRQAIVRLGGALTHAA